MVRFGLVEFRAERSRRIRAWVLDNKLERCFFAALLLAHGSLNHLLFKFAMPGYAALIRVSRSPKQARNPPTPKLQDMVANERALSDGSRRRGVQERLQGCTSTHVTARGAGGDG